MQQYCYIYVCYLQYSELTHSYTLSCVIIWCTKLCWQLCLIARYCASSSVRLIYTLTIRLTYRSSAARSSRSLHSCVRAVLELLPPRVSYVYASGCNRSNTSPSPRVRRPIIGATSVVGLATISAFRCSTKTGSIYRTAREVDGAFIHFIGRGNCPKINDWFKTIIFRWLENLRYSYK